MRLGKCVKAVIRELKTHKDYIFNFDGQALMLDDYLQVFPDDSEFIRRYACENRIWLGPLYSQCDLYCTSGESLIHNLLAGKRFCEKLGGGYSRVLYMPDTFGIPSCVPMIAKGFGLKAVCFMRGVAGQVPGLVTMEDLEGVKPQIPDGARYFRWRSADGTEIPVIRLRHGYASAAASRFFEQETGDVNFERYVECLKTAATVWDNPPNDIVMVMAGVDHMVPWERQAEAQAEASAQSDYDFQFSSLDAVADILVRAEISGLPTCRDEFHGSGAATVLGGTVSTRIYLKQKNAEIEQLLLNQVEPAISLATILGNSDPSFAIIKHAWKILLSTHCHDDICGCSVDAVHRKNESDMTQAWESGDALRRAAFFQIMRSFGGNIKGDTRPSFALVNFQGRSRLASSMMKFDFEGQCKWGDIKPPKGSYRIVDEDGNPVPFCEISREQSVENPHEVFNFEIFPELPPFTVKRFYIEKCGRAEKKSETAKTGSLEAENDFFSVVMKRNGSFDLKDKRKCCEFRNLGIFSDQADIGDSYDFSDIPDEKEKLFDNIVCRLERRKYPGGLIELRAKGDLSIPACTDSSKRKRFAKFAKIPFIQSLLIVPRYPLIEVRIEFTNNAADHRLRWNLPLNSKIEKTLAGIKYSVVERPVGARPVGVEAPRIFPEHPCDEFVAGGGLACFTPFPMNYEAVADVDCHRLALTICRSVSYLTNPNQGATRPGTNAGPHTLTPDARCLGREFRIAFGLRGYSEDDSQSLFKESLMWRSQPLFGQIDATMNPYPWRERKTSDTRLLQIEGEVVIRAFKPSEDGNGVILRLHNRIDKKQEVRVKSVTNLDFTPQSLDERNDDSYAICFCEDGILLDIPPFGVRTLRCTLRNGKVS